MKVANPLAKTKGAGTTFWLYTGSGDAFKNPLADDDWLRLAGIKDLQPGEMSADAEDDDYLDDENADWKSTTQGQKSVGDTTATLAWKPGETGQKKLVELFDTGEVRAFRIRYPNGTVDVFRGWLSSLGKTVTSKEVMTRSVKITGVGRPSLAEEDTPDVVSVTESHLGKELLEKVELTEDNASKLQQFSKEWQDANDKWNAMWGVKIEQTKDGKYYVAGLGLSMEDTPDGKISQFLVAADRIAYINPANGNETPGFVMQGDQIIMNEAFLKYLSAPTITSGGNPPAFSLTPDGKLTAKNADISGHINAVSGSFTGEINATSGKFSGVIEAREFVGDICGSKVMQGVNIRATNDERSTSTRYTDSATYQIGKTITVMANCERNGGSGAITVTININGQVKTAEVIPYTAGLPAMYQTVVFSVYTTSPVVDISVSLRVRGQYTTSASVWPLVMVSRSGNNFTN
ncbi:DUF1983 domain-containing protein [Salmonella enterica]|nr:DUF1983 domain-containing protein [Salmonella enterica]